MVKQGGHSLMYTHVPISRQMSREWKKQKGVQRFGCPDQLVPGLSPDLHPHAGLGASAEDEVGSGSVRESKMIANGQPHAQLVGGEWRWCVPSLSAPPLQKVLVQAVTQLALQRLVREMPTDALPVASQRGRDWGLAAGLGSEVTSSLSTMTHQRKTSLSHWLLPQPQPLGFSASLPNSPGARMTC